LNTAEIIQGLKTLIEEEDVLVSLDGVDNFDVNTITFEKYRGKDIILTVKVINPETLKVYVINIKVPLINGDPIPWTQSKLLDSGSSMQYMHAGELDTLAGIADLINQLRGINDEN
jgi:hypothetical protein